MADKSKFPKSQDEWESAVAKYKTLDEVCKAIQKEGVDDCCLIFAIDYSMSNMKQGKKTFGGKNLHDINENGLNPYQEVICTLGETLGPLNETRIIPAFGFGDFKCKDTSCFRLTPEGKETCFGFPEVMKVYKEKTPTVELGGPTNFAPIIEEACGIVQKTKRFHILVIVADGQVTKEEDTINAIVKASGYPMSIIVIGVGDGPWGPMKEFDAKLPERKFDNFRFVDFHKVQEGSENPDTAFALSALMQIPDAYKAIKKLQLIEKVGGTPVKH